ncbi:F-box only protein 10 isoform X2 [Lutra lutra]|uniref:F-box only protein 10 isoform X2 n=1 Tax=Lutra lutra TaxID=9657 RepID=UPI001FD0341A|nr:F-box only protein 10 isoform X2 [Lutra lutra]
MEAGGLPLELWRMILAYLHLPDLGRCSLVCRAWYELILSLDGTRWRQLCLGCTECRHPNWPNQPDVEPESWREAFKQHYLASKTWTKNALDLESSVCFSLFRRRRERRTLSVGPGHEFDSLGSALAMASLYDRIVLFPGVYEEQGEIILKVPVEIVGHGKLGEVALLASIDQHCSTTRLCNLVFMPAWFSPFMFKTTSGHVQFDNCNFENGHIQVHGPGTCQVKFCTFKNTHVFLHNVPLCVLENCEFVGSENNSVTVEGHPSADKNWAYKYLVGLIKSSPSVLPTEDSDSLMSLDLESRDQAWSPRTCDIVIEGSQSPTSPASTSPKPGSKAGSQEAEVGSDGERVAQTPDSSDGGLSPSGEDEDEDQLTYRLSYQVQGPRPVLGGSFLGPPLPGASIQLPSCLVLNSLQQELQKDKEAMALASSVQGCLIRKCLFRDGKGGVFVCSYGRAKMEGNVFRNLTYAVRCIHNSKCNQIHHGLRSGIVVLGNGKGIIRNNQIFSNKEAGIYILYHGNPVVSGNHIFKGRAAGIAVNENGKGLITENVIRENQWGGVDIRRGGVPVLRSNLICFGYSDGVVVGDEGKGLIEGNTIYANKGCGVWMMSSSLPHVTSNHVSYNGLYGVAVFSQKDGSGEFPGGHGVQENFSEDGDAVLWETELEKDDDPLRRPVTTALVESNSINHNGASGLYVQSSEALHVLTNVIHANGDRGITVAQSSQLTRVANNSISCNRQSGVKVEAQCKVELRGNGIYDNRGHGIITKGDSSVVIENDIIGNRGSGLQLLPRSDTKVIKNRIHSFRAYGIAVRGRAKALVQENIIFQGKTSKTIFQQISNNRECVLQNNKFLVFKKKSDTWRLVNPPARPHLESSLRGPSAAHSGQKGTAMATRITARVEGGYHSNRSVFCTIL